MRVISSKTTSQNLAGPILRTGSTGPAVADLQRRLAAAGFEPGAADGQFGSQTEAAVRAFQRARGLSADGEVGAKTWGALRGSNAASTPQPAGTAAHPTLSQDARGAAVQQMQQRLAMAGFSPGPDDGELGAQTREALMSFQRANGLPADGVCGPRTWAHLLSSFQPHGAQACAPSPEKLQLLQKGANGAAVSRLQGLLKQAGCDPGSVDGDFGPCTRAAVEVYQASRGLACDGVVGDQTWSALTSGARPVRGATPTSGPLRQRILQVAQGEVGTTESGENRGACLKYPHFFQRGSEPWCADFVSYVLSQAGKPFNEPYCPSIVNQMKANGHWKGRSDPQPGDLVLFDWDSDREADHIGFVKSDNGDGTIRTIEGNTEHPTTGQQGVWERTRSLSQVLGFANP